MLVLIAVVVVIVVEVKYIIGFVLNLTLLVVEEIRKPFSFEDTVLVA